MSEEMILRARVKKEISKLISDDGWIISDDSILFGPDSLLDSQRLVELCLALEDAALELGFNFDWTSDAAFSRSRSFFRSVKSLADEFVDQYNNKK